MISCCGKWREQPKIVTAWTSFLDDECFIPLLKQLTMNAVRLNTTKLLENLCYAELNEPESSFYFTNKNQLNPGDNFCYKKSPLGKNEVEKPLLKAAQNNSVRSTCISKLLDSDLPVIV